MAQEHYYSTDKFGAINTGVKLQDVRNEGTRHSYSSFSFIITWWS